MIEPDEDLTGYYAPDPPINCMLPGAPEPPQDGLARLHAAAARAEEAVGLTDVEECRIAHSGRASGLREAIRIIGEQPPADANNPATSGDAANNPLKEQIYEAMKAKYLDNAIDTGQLSPRQQLESLAESALSVVERETAQLRAERDMALAAAGEARGQVARVRAALEPKEAA